MKVGNLTGAQRPPGLDAADDLKVNDRVNHNQPAQQGSMPGCDDACLDRGYMPMGKMGPSVKGDVL